MARTAGKVEGGTWKLDSKSARAKLAARAKPYYLQIAPGKTLGYIRKRSGVGAWVCRESVNGSYRRLWNVAADDDPAKADGRDVLTYEQALRKAGAPTATATRGKPITVGEAFGDLPDPDKPDAEFAFGYLADLAARSGDRAARDAQQRAAKHVYQSLGATRVDSLTQAQIEKWRAGLLRDDPDDPDARRRSMDTANRVLSTLRAALNRAFRDDANRIPSDKAWRTVKAFRDVGEARIDHFEAKQVRLLIAKAATFDRSFAALIEAGFLTGCRLGELTGADVRDFDAKGGVLVIHKGKTGARVVTLTSEGVALFQRITKGKLPGAILLPRADAERWGKSEHFRPFRRAAALAELPKSASFYSLRHSHISRACESGMPLNLIAANVGTSVRMIEKHYGKFLAQARRDLIERTAPKLRRVK